LEDPTVTYDAASGNLYLYFIDEELLTILDIQSASIVSSVSPSDEFFTGFENMAWSTQKSLLQGVSGTVTEDGYCSDGCFQFGSLTQDGSYSTLDNIPFKAIMDDSHFLDESTNTFWIQGSYDLRDASCGPSDDDQCLLAIDSNTGNLTSAMYTNWTVYKYGSSLDGSGSMTAWLNGFDQLCKHPYDDFLFAKVNLQMATATPIACIPSDVTVQMDEWIASFSLDDSLFATASGDQYTGVGQLLVFDVQTGVLSLNTTLSGLAQELNSADGFFFVWSVDWI